MDIIDLVFSDRCTVGDSIYLKCKIEDHHCLFRRVFPDKSMLPKHHIVGALSVYHAKSGSTFSLF